MLGRVDGRGRQRCDEPRGRAALLVACAIALWTSLAGSCTTIDDARREEAKGGVGESCRTRADCDTGLACIATICTDPAAPPDASPGEAGDPCASNADCGEELTCLDSACVKVSSLLEAGEAAAIGEPCSSHDDCDTGLECVRDVCSGSEHGLEPTGKECVIVECRETEDCCPEPHSNCDLYKSICDQGGGQNYCEWYDENCVCRLEEWACVAEKCEYTPSCSDDGDCSFDEVCISSRCAQCREDSDCGGALVCDDGKCVDRCEKHEQCPIFHECQSGSCVEVGCASDLECVALFADAFAACIDAECRRPCSSDADCNPGGFQQVVCASGYCVPLGCETDEQCRIELQSQLDGNDEAECREVKAK
jgi:hypothetical protein